MLCVSGKVLCEDGFFCGHLLLDEKGIHVKQGDAAVSSDVSGLIVPRLVDGHTHIGDSFIGKKKMALPHDIESLVAPPNGLKHRLLESSSDIEIVEGISWSLEEMKKDGVSCFFDFREGGVHGVDLLNQALDVDSPNAVVLSRPKDLSFDEDEVSELLGCSAGIGLSAISDWDYDDVMRIAQMCHEQDKVFSLHASERQAEPIDKILDLHPDFLVHMLKAQRDDLEAVYSENIPIVLCPRSNDFFGLCADFELFKDVGVKLCLGSDNAMLHSLNVLQEVCFLLNKTKVFSVEELLCMVSFFPRKYLNHSGCFSKKTVFEDGFVVLDEDSLQPVFVY